MAIPDIIKSQQRSVSWAMLTLDNGLITTVYCISECLHCKVTHWFWQGGILKSTPILELLSVTIIQNSHTKPFHQIGNGSYERMNRTWGNMIQPECQAQMAKNSEIYHTWMKLSQSMKQHTMRHFCSFWGVPVLHRDSSSVLSLTTPGL